MKPLLILFALTASAFAQVVKVTPQGNVTIDGVDSGTVVGVLASRSVNASVLQTAIVEALTAQTNETKPLKDLLAKAQEALAAGDLESLKAILTPAVDDAKLSEIQREIRALNAQISTIQARIAELEAMAAKESAALRSKTPAKAAPKKPVK